MSTEDEELEHSERGPSTAHRWRNCYASVQASRGLPDDAGLEAAIGTVFHEFAGDCLEFYLDPFSFVGVSMEIEPFGKITFDTAMAQNMLAGMDFVHKMADVPGAKMIVEKKVDLQEWVGPGEFGTTDCAIVDPLNWRMIVFDWKYGGIPVSPVENDQAILYTLGTWSSFAAQMFEEEMHRRAAEKGQSFDPNVPWEDDIEVVIVIEQPRAPGGGGTWTTTMGALLAEGREIRKDADRTLEPDPPFNPGPKQCRFCKAAKHNTCVARTKMLMDEVQQDFDDLDVGYMAGTALELPSPRALTPEQRTQILLHKDQITDWLKQLHTEAYKDAETGRPTPGMKMVSGRRPARKWKDEDRARLLLTHDYGDDAYKKTLISPTQVEDKVGKKDYKDRYARLVDEGEPKPELVPESDKREALPDATSDFDVAFESNDEDALI